MKRTRLLGLGILAAAGALLCGCETEPAGSPVNITPAYSTIRYGQSIQFTASGGYDYRWTLSDASIGTLSVNTGPSTIYTSLFRGGETNTTSGTGVSQTITVTSTIQGSSIDATNATAAAQTATAIVTHL